jgi:prepilin-type N-terminal cleavage/methylation domain-containing protein
MADRRALRRDDRGETLIELVVAIAILGIAAVAILGGLLLSTQTSTIHRNSATSGAYVRSFAEAIQADVDQNGYKSCANAVDPSTGYVAVAVPGLPATYTKAVTAVQSWNGSAWGGCTADGIQRLDLKVTTPGDSVHKGEESLTVVLRKPCTGSATTAGNDPCS